MARPFMGWVRLLCSSWLKNNGHSKRTYAQAFVLGASNVLAFAPLEIWPLQLLSLSGLFALLYSEKTAKRVFYTTWSYSFAWLFIGVIWLTVTMFRYGDMPVGLAFVCVALFAAALALIPALLMAWVARFTTRVAPPLFCLVLMPTLWSVAEWTRGWIFTGFPWLVSGYAHNVSPLAGFAPIVGVYGITWLCAIVAGCMVLCFHVKRYRFSWLALGLLIAGAALRSVSWTTPSGAPVTVRLLQGNIDQHLKFQPDQLQRSLRFYHDAITKKSADLIVTPETALPLPLYAVPADYLPSLQQFAKQTNSAIMLGVFDHEAGAYTNSVVGISPTSPSSDYRYNKNHLVPFGEFIPAGFGWFYYFMNIPMGDLQRGKFFATPFAVKDQYILPTICYEDVFGEEIAAKISYAYLEHQPVPTILLNMTNLSWFGDSWALPQHRQIAQMRTLEMGRPMLRSTNTGTTLLINAQGEVVQQLAPFVQGEIEVSVQGYQGLTPYIMGGNYFWLGLMGLVLFIAHITASITQAKTVGHAKHR